MNSRTKAILVDDEVSNLKGLQKKIENLFKDIEVIAAVQTPERAIEIIESHKFDILFLDIEMPRIDGFELLSRVDNIDFQVIFVTAYSEYAVEAFKKSAVDYILKPIDDEDLKSAINKTLSVIKQKKQDNDYQKLVGLLTENLSKNNKIIVPTAKGVSFVAKDKIIHLEGYEGYTRIHSINKETITSSYNLGKFEKLLGSVFFKCHKSHIINLDKVKSFENQGYVVLENLHRVPISKPNRKLFLSLFK